VKLVLVTLALGIYALKRLIYCVDSASRLNPTIIYWGNSELTRWVN